MSRSKNIQLIGEYGTYNAGELSVGAGQYALDHINPLFLEEVFAFRGWHGYQTFISSFYRGGDPGAHGEGVACDQILFNDYLHDPIAPLELYLRATSWPFRGVGLYFDWAFTDWESKEGKRAPGIHVDNSEERTRPLRWIAASYTPDGQSVAPLLLPDDQRKACERIFYYQDLTDGLFKSRNRSDSYSLEDAIAQFYWNV